MRRWHVVADICLRHGYRYGAELGVKEGRFTCYLCETIPDLKMISVDLWDAQPDKTEVDPYLLEPRKVHESNMRKFFERCAPYAERVAIRRMLTSRAAQDVAAESLDFIFIDADHSYEGCLADIKAWTPKVRAGGMVSGHDYNAKWPGVVKAVQETGPVMTSDDSVWFRFKP